MKQTIFKSFSVLLAILMFSIQTFAYSSKISSPLTKSEIQTVTEFDDSEIYAAFSEVNDLDQYLSQNENSTYADISREDVSMLTNISATTSLPVSASSDELALGIPSFLWGCVFGIVGVLVVYLMTDNNKEQTKKAFYGCIVGTVVSVVIYVAVFAAAASTTTTTY